MTSGTQTPDLAELLGGYRPRSVGEAADHERLLGLVGEPGAWDRGTPLHFTASALIVHPATKRVLLRWHVRQQAWLQVGGHGDPGETLPLEIALREGREETHLTDLAPWPDASLVHLTVVPVPASPREPAHEHADLRFLLATGMPEAARPENPESPLEWLTVAGARERTTEENFRETLDRAGRLLDAL
ncbi:NUDIX domain-containing protein [Streptacidiphilus sp. ASG 303]|uniref:NUDIX hydrolase n=1 Tax=Streptacidiphilus sp. ASG 303 TaxID=2896847 RepID=UPI001E47B93F|nr:NUDIX domain-containing protein [Streptacidiphilus sp. ASG 303]MCD0485882.1 NUDIX domain-containing protein [Streptacidiphilus sp. ASG 303]